MHEMNLGSLDMNLLVVLEALLRLRSVTGAGRELGRSQPAISHALGRLRALLGDALLVPGKGGMTLTPRAAAMQEPLVMALSDLRRALEERATFDPSQTRRTFCVGSPDLLALLSPALWRWLRGEAPGAGLELRALVAGEAQRAALESGELDVAVGPAPPEGERWVAQRIGGVRWISVVRRGHPLSAGACGLGEWLSWPHVVVRTGSESGSVVGGALRAGDHARQIGLIAPSFTVAMCAVGDSELVLTAPCPVGVLERFGLVSLEPPIALPQVEVWMYWHRRWRDDAAHQWLRRGLGQTLREALREAGQGDASVE
jgi:DNA-binding transcriptional LysR family regulator